MFSFRSGKTVVFFTNSATTRVTSKGERSWDECASTCFCVFLAHLCVCVCVVCVCVCVCVCECVCVCVCVRERESTHARVCVLKLVSAALGRASV